MSIRFNEEQTLLRDSLRRWLKDKVTPIIPQAEADQKFPFEVFDGLLQFGCFGGRLSEQQGGFGLDYTTWGMLFEEMGYCWGSLRTLANITNGTIYRLADQGTPEQKERYLKPLLKNEIKCCTGLSEPNIGSNLGGLETRCEDKGDHWLLNGTKLWITNGEYADFCVVAARTYSPNCNGGISTFIVDRELYEMRKVNMMVLRCTGTAELSFQDVKLPKEALIGEEGKAFSKVLNGLDAARVNIAMGAVGAAQSALDLSIEYAKTRKQFGRPIGEFQLIQRNIVEMTMRVSAARALAYNAAQALDEGHQARSDCSIAKLYATEAAFEVANTALQLHGGLGYATDYPIERIFRDTRGGTIPEGTSEIQTLIIGREILGMSAIS
ncbi:MAG: acyl-CoA dehydrogenase family protein [Burkholderiaceae bacterium]